MLGQQVTQLLTDGVAVNSVASSPSSGNEDGSGASSGNTGGLGFGPAGKPPAAPIDQSDVAPSKLRRGVSSSDLRVTGVQVLITATRPLGYADIS